MKERTDADPADTLAVGVCLGDTQNARVGLGDTKENTK